jgi:hypothetical protein
VKARNPASLIAAALTLAVPHPSRAAAPALFGAFARSAALARADLADPSPTAAPRSNPALAAVPGARVDVGYGASAMGLTFNGASASVARASGLDLGLQLATSLDGAPRRLVIGAAIAAHLPDAALAAITFRPATEPQFVLYEAPLARIAVDAVAAARYGPIALGAGLSIGVGAGGHGIDFLLGQDGAGTFASAGLDVALDYRFAPIVGLAVDLGRIAIGASVRGAMAIDLDLSSAVLVALHDNPLVGTTTVRISGAAGFDPTTVDLGARLRVTSSVSAFAALTYAVYSAAPPPVADVTLDVRLGTTPSLREVRFPAPRFRDTLSPHLGVEVSGDVGPVGAYRLAGRAGYALAPSPVPPQTKLTSYADANRHQIAIGAGVRAPRVAGIRPSLDLAVQLHLLEQHTEQKESASYPYASFDVGGRILYGAATLGATW